MPEIKQKNSQSVNQLLQEYKDVTSKSPSTDVVRPLLRFLPIKIRVLEHHCVTLLKAVQQHIDQEIDFSLSVGFGTMRFLSSIKYEK